MKEENLSLLRSERDMMKEAVSEKCHIAGFEGRGKEALFKKKKKKDREDGREMDSPLYLQFGT